MTWAQDGTVVPQTFLKFQSHGSHSYMLEDTGVDRRGWTEVPDGALALGGKLWAGH